MVGIGTISIIVLFCGNIKPIMVLTHLLGIRSSTRPLEDSACMCDWA